MSISGIGGGGAAGFYGTAGRSSGVGGTGTGQTTDNTTDGIDGPEKTFLDYMKKTPAQRMIDNWLAQHHLTQKDLDRMSPEQRKAIEQQMAADLRQQTKEQTHKKVGVTTDIFA